MGGMGSFNPGESNNMTKIVNRKTGQSLNVDYSINNFLRATREAEIDINNDLALIDCRNNTIEFEGNDDSFHNILKGKL